MATIIVDASASTVNDSTLLGGHNSFISIRQPTAQTINSVNDADYKPYRKNNRTHTIGKVIKIRKKSSNFCSI